MRIAIFSDIHGNYDALQKLYSNIEKQNVEKIFFLGDVFFRGCKVKECIDFLIEKNIFCIAGNCELYFANGVEIDADVLMDKSYYDEIRVYLGEKYLSWAKNLPLEYVVECSGKRILLSHFYIDKKSSDYPYLPLSSLNDGTFESSVKANPYDYMVFGHSHKKFVKGNVISIPASGLGECEYLVMDISEKIEWKILN